MSKKARIVGVKRTASEVNYIMPETLHAKYELKEYIEVSATRSSNKANVVAIDDDELVAIQFTDNTEWIGHPEDVQEIYDKNTLMKRSSSSEDYIFDTQISTKDASRGLIKRALVKVFSVFKPKDVASVSMKVLAKAYDNKVQPHPGLYRINASLNREEIKGDLVTSQPYLLLLHGTLSTTIDAFYGLNINNGAWNKIVANYGSNILALEHHTLSVSPFKNALDFLEACPDNITIDILSHSRGGLVADILAKCDQRNSVIGFSNNELEIIKSFKEEEGVLVKGNSKNSSNYQLMLKINELAAKKRLTVNKVVRVAAPASGTTILSRRVDHYFNLVLNALSLAFGVRNPIYQTVKGFLLELISQKEDPETLPGLNSMMPESGFQKMLNAADTSVESVLYNIAGDADIGGINFNSLKVILANLFYQGDNDLVVDTKRMKHGVKHVDGMFSYTSQGSETNHFNYFSNKDSCLAILQALELADDAIASLYTKEVYTKGQRGVLLDMLSLEGISFNVDLQEIKRDVVILIPGIMGSSLAQDNEDQWVDIREMNKGAIRKNLNISAKNVKATGVIKKFYGKFAEHLSKDYDVITLQFDWRKSLKEAAKELKLRLDSILKAHDVNIHIVAHSMGGLVVRQCMMSHASTWANFKENEHNKFIMLGTPWMGSYLIMEVLTGHSSRVKQLAAIDFTSNRSDLLKIFWKFPGVFELLPIEQQTNRTFWLEQFWDDLQKKSKLKHMPKPNTNLKSLSEFDKYREAVLDFNKALSADDFNNVYYICGKADETVFDYELKNRFLSRKKKLVYKATNEGDGSVTWATGIPKELINTSRLYYTHTSHGDLANETYIFDGVQDILETGRTNQLATQPSVSRGGEVISEVHDYSEPLSNSDEVVNTLFNVTTPKEPETEAFNVKVVHGDLRVSSYPVMVGHFFMDLILSAEKALDEYLDHRLSQRMAIGYYPGKIGESEVFFNLKTQPKGAIVCGLGNSDVLTPFLMAKTVRLAVLKYAMFMRDNYTLAEAKQYANGISFILMGIGYGKMPIEDSLNGILLGIAQANKKINQTKEGLKPVKNIEIVNYYESFSSQAYFCLSRLKNADNRIKFNLSRGITKRAGAKKRQQFNHDEYNQWYNLHIASVINAREECEKDPDSGGEKIDGFKYFSSKGLARVEQEMVGIGLHKINHLLEEMSTSSVWDRRLSKSLFEMLIPNEFKNTFRNQTNIVLKIDKEAAQIPWELLHDTVTSNTPASVTSSFIRQLVTEDSGQFNPVGLNVNDVLVIGDPLYNREDLIALPAAKAEAEWVTTTLDQAGFDVNSQVNKNAKDIMMELFNKTYKIMHFAGHGVYDPENCDVGIAIGNGISIDPAMINQLGYVPEFVFINCCFSGAMDASDDAYSRERYRLAANVGTQLIEMGVKAIIISGWAVDDAAAKTFSETFYKRMLQGYNFGTSVQMARRDSFQNHRGTNTWGAYQCYGNQFYKFDSRYKSEAQKNEYVIASQVHTDLDNLLISIRDKKENKKSAQTALDAYLDRAKEANMLDAMVLEKEALIYDELGMTEIAYLKYKDLFRFENGNYSIKALEQYCVVQSSRTLTYLDAAKKADIKPGIEAYINEIKLLTLAGRNASRLNIVGNAYKQTAKYLDLEHKIEQLSIAYNYYEEAYKTTSDKYDGQSLNAESNMISIAFIIEQEMEKNPALKPRSKKAKDLLTVNRLFSSKGIKNWSALDTYLKAFFEELDEFDKADLDISVLFGMTEVCYARILINRKDPDQLYKKILKIYGDILK